MKALEAVLCAVRAQAKKQQKELNKLGWELDVMTMHEEVKSAKLVDRIIDSVL